MSPMTTSDLTFASAEVAAELRRWLAHLGAERRMSPKTVEAYERDVRQFLRLSHRAYRRAGDAEGARRNRAARRARLHGVAARRRDRLALADALARGRALVRALSRTQRQGQGRRARPPCARRKCRRPCRSRSTVASAKRLADTDLRAGEEREPWVLARDAAVLALLYGSGLRISEALGLDARGGARARQGRRHHGHRQGQQDPHGAGAAAGAAS